MVSFNINQPLNQNKMKSKQVTVQFDYTNSDSLEIILNKLKHELTQGKEFFEDVVKDTSYNNRYLHFKQEYKKKRSFKIEENVILVKSYI
jgi:hypothetical protein